MKEHYELDFLKFHDEDFLLRPMDHIQEFAMLYKQEIGIPFVIETNSKSINKRKARILREMNCVSVSLGVESGNEKLRKSILNRKDSVSDIKNAVKILNNEGIRTVAFLMLNIPFDSREAIFDSIELVRQSGVRIPTVGIFFPFEKTKARNLAIENNFFRPDDVSVYRTDLPALNQPTISREEIMRLRKVFVLYAKLPKSYWPIIERAEEFDAVGKEIYLILRKIYAEYVRDQGDYFMDATFSPLHNV